MMAPAPRFFCAYLYAFRTPFQQVFDKSICPPIDHARKALKYQGFLPLKRYTPALCRRTLSRVFFRFSCRAQFGQYFARLDFGTYNSPQRTHFFLFS